MHKSILASLAVVVGGFVFTIMAPQALGQAAATSNSPEFWKWSQRPVMGWNSWDCYGAGVNEEQTLANAAYMDKNLKSHGWNLVTVDIQWYEPLAHTDQYRRGAVLEMDANGRLLPAANRFPSTKDTHSFKPLADKLHAMGLKFGVHLMRGIPRQAVDRDNVLILGTTVHAADIADKTPANLCRWNTDMYGVDMSKPGAQEYYDSVFALLASWEIDLVKVDDLSAPTFRTPEVEAIRKAIDKTHRPIIFSTSPGATPVNQGPIVQMNANQWRVSNDFWDSWPALKSQFARLDAWTPFRGPGHFPDADMLPIGNIRTWAANGTWTNFTHDELITLMTLWSIARSPLIIGGNLPNNDEFTLGLLTNDELIKVNQRSTSNRQLFNNGGVQYAWVADAEDSASKYVALFNAPDAPGGRGRRGAPATVTSAPAPGPLTISVPIVDLKLDNSLKVANIRDLWSHKDLGAKDAISAELPPHGAAIFEIQVSRK